MKNLSQWKNTLSNLPIRHFFSVFPQELKAFFTEAVKDLKHLSHQIWEDKK